MLLFLARPVSLVELDLANNKLFVRLVCRAEVRRRTEWEETHKVLYEGRQSIHGLRQG